MKKAQTAYTVKMLNRAAYEDRKAIRSEMRHIRALEQGLDQEHTANDSLCYVNIGGVAFPTPR